MKNPRIKSKKRHRRHQRVRAKIFGTKECPRLSVFRSSKHIYAQLINDEKGKTLVASSDQEFLKPSVKARQSSKSKKESPSLKEKKAGKVAVAYRVGKLIAQKALKMEVTKVIFDRGGYKYHGRVKALAEGAREGGLKF